VWPAEAVFVCALGLLGRSAKSFPPVDLVDHAPAGVSTLAQGFVQPNKRIALITSTSAFANARQSIFGACSNIEAIREIAGVLAHEEWHVLHGSDENSAYEAQLTALVAVGANQGSNLYHKVFVAKLTVAAAAKRDQRSRMLARDGG
jgi:anthranilate/para-aminobenzoate synthase component II